MTLPTFIWKLPRRLRVSALVVVGIVVFFSKLMAVVAVLCMLLLVLVVYRFLRLSLPQTRGTIRVSGPRGRIEILRDSDFIPHIRADNQLDAYFGLGYVHAQDRLWQMDFQRRLGQGRLSEILGRSGLPFDRLTRTLGFHLTAGKTWNLADEDTRQTVVSYTAGINAFIASRRSWRLPPEFILVRARPQLWSGADVMLMSTMMAWNLSGNYITELLRERLIRSLGPERAKQYIPDYSDVEEASPPETQPHAVLLRENVTTAGADDWGAIQEGVGSNMWMASPGRCEGGGPILANDPHLPSSSPMTWYLAHMTAPGLDVIGGTTPGIPGVIVGRNSHIAWGMTNLNPDIQDFFRERLSQNGTRYEFQGHTESLEIREETIRVRKGQEVKLAVRSTRHGPIVNDVIGGEDAELAKDDFLTSAGPLSFQWTGMNPQNSSVRAFLLLARSSSWSEFTHALKFCVCPAVSFGYADIDGNIGYHAAGAVPVRSSGNGSRPADGWNGEHEWTGAIPFEELPHAYNPPTDFLVLVNCPPPDAEYPCFLGCDWVEPYRLERITELLSVNCLMNVTDHMSIQADTLSMHAREMLPLLLSHATGDDPSTSHVIELLRNWDLNAEKDSVGITMFSAWHMHLLRILARRELNDKLLNAYEPWTSWSNRLLLKVLNSRDSGGDEPGSSVRAALDAAVRDLRSRLGKNIDKWEWGKVHKAILPHLPFNRVSYLRPFFSRSIAVGGDWSTVNFGGYVSRTPFLQRNMPGYRQVIDLSRLDGGLFIHASGQSGHFLSSHFDDFTEDWANVKYRPMRFDRSTINRDTKAKLELQPEPGKAAGAH